MSAALMDYARRFMALTVPEFQIAEAMARGAVVNAPEQVQALEAKARRAIAEHAREYQQQEPSPPPMCVTELPVLPIKTVTKVLEESWIRQALERTGGNRAQAARLIGMNRTALVERLKRMDAT